MNDPLILGIETSGILCSVAWWKNGRVLLEYNIEQANVHSEILPELVHTGCEYLKIDIESIQLVTVGNGPGSFTGLRIGMSYAKGLAFGLKIPLIPVTNFELLFAQAQVHLFPRIAVIDARRGQYYCGIQASKEHLELIVSIQKWDDIFLVDKKMRCVVLENNIKIEPEMKVPQNINLVDGIRMHASGLCLSALEKYKNGFNLSLNEIEPIYLQAFAGVI